MACIVGSDPLAVVQVAVFSDNMIKGAVTPDNSWLVYYTTLKVCMHISLS